MDLYQKHALNKKLIEENPNDLSLEIIDIYGNKRLINLENKLYEDYYYGKTTFEEFEKQLTKIKKLWKINITHLQ